MQNICIDTSTFIEFSRTKAGSLIDLKILASKEKAQLITSSIVIFEFWSGKSMNLKKRQALAKEIFEQVRVIEVTPAIAKKAGELVRSNCIRNYDAIIAATALEHHATIATLNHKHFVGVEGLKVWKG